MKIGDELTINGQRATVAAFYNGAVSEDEPNSLRAAVRFDDGHCEGIEVHPEFISVSL